MEIKSITNVITNSSSEAFLLVNSDSIDKTRELINTILRVAGSTKTCDDLFDITPKVNEYRAEWYWNSQWQNECLNEKFAGQTEIVLGRDNTTITEQEKADFICKKALEHEDNRGYDYEERPLIDGIKITPKSGVDDKGLDLINDIFGCETIYC